MVGKKTLFNFTIIIIGVSFLTLIYFAFFSKNYIKIEIKNNTNSTINNLKIKSTELKHTITIPPIKSNEKYKLKIDSSEELTNEEASIQLEHINNKTQEFFNIISYIEKGSGENIKVILKNYENGKLTIDINGEELTGVSEKEMYGEK